MTKLTNIESVKFTNPCKSVIQIITKGQDEHLDEETEEGEGTRFVVRLPINTAP